MSVRVIRLNAILPGFRVNRAATRRTCQMPGISSDELLGICLEGSGIGSVSRRKGGGGGGGGGGRKGGLSRLLPEGRVGCLA